MWAVQAGRDGENCPLPGCVCKRKYPPELALQSHVLPPQSRSALIYLDALSLCPCPSLLWEGEWPLASVVARLLCTLTRSKIGPMAFASL